MTDKTLVAWVTLANLTQRGGSALTIEDGKDHFDGIVFGEIAPGKWMAGSDFYARTTQNQSDTPTETATNTLIQVAITYQGREVTLYRNGQQIEHHTMNGEPQPFGEHSRVTIGLRHRRATDHARFAGSIDDARIYAQALTADQLKSLKPNEPSTIKPWAWWTFTNKSAIDLTGRFKRIEITNAKVEGGMLVLDGNYGELQAGERIVEKLDTPTIPNPIPKDWFTFHLAHVGPKDLRPPGDPNCAFYWRGEYHLHYIYQNDDGIAFAHVSSRDMVHWKWHPSTLTPSRTGHGMFSGTGFFTKEGRPAIIYHGLGSGRNQIAVSQSDNLEKWSKPWPLIPTIKPGQDPTRIANWDPDAWIDGGNYYALSGGIPGSGKPTTIFRSSNLKDWDYLGDFLTHDMPGVKPNEDISCPNFFRIGNKWMLLCISHTLGCRYYLGDWNNEHFDPEFHGRMNWHDWDCFAPESLLTPDGRRVMWAWSRIDGAQSAIQTLPRELSLPADGVLRIKPLRELQSLRFDPSRETNVLLADGQPRMLQTARGDALELQVNFAQTAAREFGLDVQCEANGGSGLPIRIIPGEKVLRIGTVSAPFELKPGEPLTLRVFIDKNMIEVFANDRQAMVASHTAKASNDHIQLVSLGPSTTATEVSSWRMKSSFAR